MKVTQIPFQKTGFFSKTMLDYLEQEEAIRPFYNNDPTKDGFKQQLEEKEASFPKEHREVLLSALQNQYANIEVSSQTQENMDSLLQTNTFTVTTGHQLNLFTGPLYFLYKIFSTINLAEELRVQFPKHAFVPVYWMATEDHDFDEINYFNFKEKKVQWKRDNAGAVGHFSTKGLKSVFEAFSQQLGTSRNAAFLKNLFEQGYLHHNTLAEATRYIANELFASYGLVIVDGDDASLKSLYAPIVAKELTEQVSFKSVSNTISALEKQYKIQVNPREINQFYLSDASRERIVKEGNHYRIHNTTTSFSEKEILAHLKESPEKFSPNVIMRPVYQEAILPNLAYIGGGGELAYWLQLKAYFKQVQLPFPILILRNSVQIISSKQQQKLDALNISIEEMFLKKDSLLKKKVNENSDIEFNFSDAQTLLEQQFMALRRVANETDASFLGAVLAQEKKQLNGLKNLENRLLRAEKRGQKDLVFRISQIKEQLFPNQSLEERQRNFSEYYLEYGDAFLETLKSALKPLDFEFTVLEL